MMYADEKNKKVPISPAGNDTPVDFPSLFPPFRSEREKRANPKGSGLQFLNGFPRIITVFFWPSINQIFSDRQKQIK